MNRPFFSAAAFACILLIFCCSTLRAEPTPEQQRKITAAANYLKAAGRYFGQKRYPQSAAAVKSAQEEVEELTATGDAEIIKQLEPTIAQLKKVHSFFVKNGFKLPELNIGEVKAAPAPGATPMPAVPAGAVSFVKDVAPMLVSKCGRCHVNRAAGDFSMANFAALKRGVDGAVVFFAGDAKGSRLVEVIESGDMPRGGAKVSAAELTTLKKWITEGAKYDGGNETTSLATLAPNAGGGAAASEPVAVMKATGKETVSFARDIAPMLVESCSGCHINAQRVRGGLNMDNFTRLMRGGDSGAILAPGKPAASLLVMKLKGMGDGQQMPLNRTPFTNEQIALVEKWIAEGATYDGAGPNDPLPRVAALAKARLSTHADLSAERAENSDKDWLRGMPGIDAQKVETTNFLLMGNVGEANLKKHSEMAEAIVPKIADLFGAEAGKPLIKGRQTLFVFDQRYDYSEFGKMVERREIPKSMRGHWKYNVVDAYGAFYPSRTKKYTTEALITQQVAGAYIASLQSLPPRWFAEGAARVATNQLAADDPRVKQWNAMLPEAKASMAKPDDFMNGKPNSETADVAAYGFVKWLMTDKKRFSNLLDALRVGDDFDQAVAKNYGAEPMALAATWAKTRTR